MIREFNERRAQEKEPSTPQDGCAVCPQRNPVASCRVISSLSPGKVTARSGSPVLRLAQAEPLAPNHFSNISLAKPIRSLRKRIIQVQARALLKEDGDEKRMGFAWN
jgi:hypothetical protein